MVGILYLDKKQMETFEQCLMIWCCFLKIRKTSAAAAAWRRHGRDKRSQKTSGGPAVSPQAGSAARAHGVAGPRGGKQ